MKNLYIFLFIFYPIIFKSQDLLWVNKIQGASNSESIHKIKLDKLGNVLIIGEIQGYTPIDLDPGTGIYNMYVSGTSDNFLGKYDTSGNFIWAIKFEESFNSSYTCTDLFVENNGDIILTGIFNGTIDFDPSSNVYNVSSSSSSFSFVCKINSNGNFLWVKVIGTNILNGSDAISNSISNDHSGNIYITGYFNGTIDFDPGSSTFNLSSSSNQDAFVVKLNYSGNFIWARKIGGGFWKNNYCRQSI